MLFSLLDGTAYHLKRNTKIFSGAEALPALCGRSVVLCRFRRFHPSQQSELHNVLCRLAGVILHPSGLRNMYYGYSSFQVILIVLYNPFCTNYVAALPLGTVVHFASD